ncbi:MAG: glycosyl hydrolase 108 family protein [Hyphomonadaceae bacterium]|nr:glycosyl hydrolase 108 family protein [Hyphomonadaceae bacterium]
MRANYNPLLKTVVGVEGGISDRPLSADPGGLTNKGVTQATYDKWRAKKDLPPQSVRKLTVAEYTDLYRTEFWDEIKGDTLPSGIDLAVFDYAVNSGPSRAAKDLQRTLGVKADSHIGLATMEALEAANHDDVVAKLSDRRLRFMKSLKNWEPNKNGWTKRVAHIKAVAMDMARGAPPPPKPLLTLKAEATGKAVEAEQAQLKTADGAGLSATTVGGLGQTAMERAQEVQPHIGDTVLGRAAIAVFVLLMLVGIGLLAFAQLKRVREKGGLSGYIGGLLQ